MGVVSADHRSSTGLLTAGSKLGRYEILAKLAAGGMAVVYVARAQGVAGFERLVAIKVLHANLAHEEEFIKMFLDEARLAARIRHPNVVPTIDISDSDEAGYFIVMDYIEGDHLGQILASAAKAEERLPLPVTLRIAVDALGGLGAAHDLCDESGKPLHLVHRDVSPHNIMVGRDGVARLTDFGVAKAEDRLTHTRDGQVKGKLAYMAPEQASSGQTDSRSDLFSMGVILWECVTGRRLFRAESTAATLHKLIHDEIPKPSTVDPSLAPLDAVLAKALSRDIDRRYQTAEEFAQAIEDVAPEVAGIASLRGVSKAVKQYAAVKLKRDKKLIDDAVHALRGSEDSQSGVDLVQEPTSPSVSDVSLTGGSLSMSKVSGVYAHATMPGIKSPGAEAAKPPPIAAPPPIVAPPPIGAVPSTLPGPLSQPPAARRGPRLLVLVLGVIALVVVAWLAQTTDEVRVQSIDAAPPAINEPKRPPDTNAAAGLAPPPQPTSATTPSAPPPQPTSATTPSAPPPPSTSAITPPAPPPAVGEPTRPADVKARPARGPRASSRRAPKAARAPAPAAAVPTAPAPAPAPKPRSSGPDLIPNPYQN